MTALLTPDSSLLADSSSSVALMRTPHNSSFQQRESLSLQPDLLWKIENGFVRTLTWNDNGEIATLGIWGAGDVVGQPFSQLEVYQIECLTPVNAIALPYPECCPPETMQLHIQQMESLFSIFHTKHTRLRLLRLLDLLAHRFSDEVDQGRLIDARLTHQVIAELTGTTRVTVTRLLNQLENEGKITRSRRQRILLHH